MRLRAVHFACVILLLSTFGVAEASVLQDGGRLRGEYVGILLQHGAAAVSTESAFPSGTIDALRASLPVESLAQSRTVWTMRAPSAHSARMHAVTGFGR